MPEDSKKLVSDFSNQLKSFNKILAQIEKNPENMSQLLEDLKNKQKEIAISTRKYLNALNVDPKILGVMNSLIESKKRQDSHIQKSYDEQIKELSKKSISPMKDTHMVGMIVGSYEEKKKSADEAALKLDNLKRNPPKPSLDPQQKVDWGSMDVRSIALAIRKEFIENSESSIKADAESKMLFFQVSPNPMDTIKNIREIFATLSSNPRALRLEKSEESKKINIEDLQKLQILWQGASIITDESNAHYLKRNLIIAAEAIISSLCGAVAGVMIVINMTTVALIPAAEFAAKALGNLAILNRSEAASYIAKSFGVLISVPMAALPVIFTKFYTSVVSRAQNRKNAQEVELLDQVLKKVIAVSDAVTAIENKIGKINNEIVPDRKSAPDLT